MNVAVIGGGWAGLTAAFYLQEAGHAVQIFEAAHTLGGRAKRVYSRNLDSDIDNGQHILLGAYSETLALMEALGLNRNEVLYREALCLRSTDREFRLGPSPLPAPLHLLGAMVTAKGVSLRERWQLARVTYRLRRQHWKTTPGQTVGQWLELSEQSERLIQQFWRPLCVAAMNTPVDRACAQLFAHVLRDSLGGSRAASDVLIPRVDLTALWPERMMRLNNGPNPITIRYGKTIRQLHDFKTHISVDGFDFDAVVVAGNAFSTHRLLASLPESPASAAYLGALKAFEYLPISTISLMLERPWRLPHAMTMLHDDPARLHFGQWLFDRSVFYKTSTHDDAPRVKPLLNVVVSDAGDIQRYPRKEVIAATIQQVQEQTGAFSAMPKVLASELITEKRATFMAVPGLIRPGNDTPWPRVWVAGDWTDTGYPGVLEGATRSGRNAARLLSEAT
jgi:squalene-associated FAD-dependent desaturase